VQQLADLPQSEPAEVVVRRHVVEGLDDHVAVGLAQEPGAVLRLEHVGEHPAPARPGEVLEVLHVGTPMHAGVVAVRGLHGRRELQQVRIARLHLGLHQEVQYAVELLGQDAEDPHLGLHDDRLLPLAAADHDVQPLHAEEPPAAVHEVAAVRFERPALDLRERHPLDGEAVRLAAPGEPGVEVLGPHARAGRDGPPGTREPCGQPGVIPRRQPRRDHQAGSLRDEVRHRTARSAVTPAVKR
jgi:hypothetical protein